MQSALRLVAWSIDAELVPLAANASGSTTFVLFQTNTDVSDGGLKGVEGRDGHSTPIRGCDKPAENKVWPAVADRVHELPAVWISHFCPPDLNGVGECLGEQLEQVGALRVTVVVEEQVGQHARLGQHVGQRLQNDLTDHRQRGGGWVGDGERSTHCTVC